MPEGPECRIVAQGLHKILEGHELSHLVVTGGRYTKVAVPGIDLISNPRPVASCRSKGKLIVVEFADGGGMLSTLGMSGRWQRRREKHCDVTLVYRRRGGPSKSLYFCDQRHYGTLRVVTPEGLESALGARAPDVLDEEIGDEQFLELCEAQSSWTLPRLLMDQSKVSGVGNYLKAEILYYARADPRLPIAQLPVGTLMRVRRLMHEIPRAALRMRGMTVRDYRDVEGTPGAFGSRLAVYRKKTDPYGHPVETFVGDDGRTTHWVPALQAVPGARVWLGSVRARS